MGRFAAIAGIVLALAATPARAVPLDDRAWKEIETRLAAAATDARDDRPDDALRKCNEARSYAARYDQDALIGGKIEICFGRAAMFRKDRKAACAAYARALPLLNKAEPNDAELDLDQAKRSHSELGC